MLNLENVEAGTLCTIVWLLGRMGDYLRTACHFNEDDNLNVILNYGDGSVIVSHDGRRYAMGPDASHAIKVQTK